MNPATFENLGRLAALQEAATDADWVRQSCLRCAEKAATETERNLHVSAATTAEILMKVFQRKAEQVAIMERGEAA
jgi:hypothetical protein